VDQGHAATGYDTPFEAKGSGRHQDFASAKDLVEVIETYVR
jgi:hypothetical protein